MTQVPSVKFGTVIVSLYKKEENKAEDVSDLVSDRLIKLNNTITNPEKKLYAGLLNIKSPEQDSFQLNKKETLKNQLLGKKGEIVITSLEENPEDEKKLFGILKKEINKFYKSSEVEVKHFEDKDVLCSLSDEEIVAKINQNGGLQEVANRKKGSPQLSLYHPLPGAIGDTYFHWLCKGIANENPYLRLAGFTLKDLKKIVEQSSKENTGINRNKNIINLKNNIGNTAAHNILSGSSILKKNSLDVLKLLITKENIYSLGKDDKFFVDLLLEAWPPETFKKQEGDNQTRIQEKVQAYENFQKHLKFLIKQDASSSTGLLSEQVKLYDAARKTLPNPPSPLLKAVNAVMNII